MAQYEWSEVLIGQQVIVGLIGEQVKANRSITTDVFNTDLPLTDHNGNVVIVKDGALGTIVDVVLNDVVPATIPPPAVVLVGFDNENGNITFVKVKTSDITRVPFKIGDKVQFIQDTTANNAPFKYLSSWIGTISDVNLGGAHVNVQFDGYPLAIDVPETYLKFYKD
jgi:hypothetical protein